MDKSGKKWGKVSGKKWLRVVKVVKSGKVGKSWEKVRKSGEKLGKVANSGEK